MNKVFLFLLFGVIGFSQSFEGESFKLNTINGISTFTFEDKNSDGRYVSGVLVKNYLVLSFKNDELIQFKKNLKKVSKKSELTIEAETYGLDKYSWDDGGSIYVRVGNKIGEINKKEVKKLLK